MQQLRLSFGHDKESVESYLAEAIRMPLSLTITDNSTSMISCRHCRDIVLLRLHRMFLIAGHDVLDELAAFIMRKTRSTPLVRAFINDNADQIRRVPPGSKTLRTHGRQHNLRKMFDEINEQYFGRRVSAGITWGAKGPRRYARTRTLGSYSSDDNIIRLNPILDSKRVPKYFVEFVLYHEMLHADIGIEGKNGGRSRHSNAFKKREQMFRHYKRAMKWERERY